MGETFGVGYDWEKPAHQVCVSDFTMGKFPVTQGQWKRVMGSNPSYFSSCGDQCPVENVSWNEAQVFIHKLNSQSDKQYRLPTEAEWEYACRSGGKHEMFCGGNDIEAVAWYDRNSEKQTHPVGQKQPNGLGLYDMSGNVWQWVQDWYGSYGSGSEKDPRGPVSGSQRVFRGGCWLLDAESARAVTRRGIGPGKFDDNLGFRLVAPVR
ncbi:formylglycine-generating enzyme family protein [Geomonas sp. Red875]|uniref:Formylglycine-generating enzyme family protein n=2 Tax=Geomesophilobacter sediminis TaxID=2798584 RepID=A0A8J7SB24_9BACT|nr:formylglycine-generating enzyme family protein [Geomesophilobacter sediminis]